MTLLMVILGGAVGAPLRYLTDRGISARRRSVFPWGTFTVNMIGCLVLGLLAGAAGALPAAVGVLVGTGFCGALTTYSTFGYEAVQLVEIEAYRFAAAYIAGTLVGGLAGAAAGYSIGMALV